MIEEKFSFKIRVLSFIGMVNVVMIHSHALRTFESPAHWCSVLQTFLFRAITSWAVPFFFVVSGYLFAKSSYFRQGGGYRLFVAKKMRTLLLPYLLWTIIGTAISLPLIMGNNYIMHKGLFERTFLADGFCLGAINMAFGVTEFGPLHNMALWYVRTLFLFFIAAPLFRLVAKIGNVSVMVFAIVLILLFPETELPFASIFLGPIGWFLIGIWLSIRKIDERVFPVKVVPLVVALYCCVGVFFALGESCQCLIQPAHTMIAKRALPILGILSWYGIVSSLDIWKGGLPSYMGMTFWVYCLHGVVTGWLLAGTFLLLGKSNVSAMVASLVSIVGSLSVSFTTGYSLKSRVPRLYYVLTGNRA